MSRYLSPPPITRRSWFSTRRGITSSEVLNWRLIDAIEHRPSGEFGGQAHHRTVPCRSQSFLVGHRRCPSSEQGWGCCRSRATRGPPQPHRRPAAWRRRRRAAGLGVRGGLSQALIHLVAVGAPVTAARPQRRGRRLPSVAWVPRSPTGGRCRHRLGSPLPWQVARGCRPLNVATGISMSFVPNPSSEMPSSYYCRHCGASVRQAAVVCVSCGCEPWSGTEHCWHCAAATQDQAHVCVNCGVSLVPRHGGSHGHNAPHRSGAGAPRTSGFNFLTTPANGLVSSRNAVAAGVLAILLGSLGVHRFYLGYIGVGFGYLGVFLFAVVFSFLVLPLVLLLALSVLALLEGIFLLTGSFNTDAEGAELIR